jgi:hypothetical protein
MKTILFAFLFLLVPKLCISQGITDNDLVTYLDENFKLGTADNYRYLEIIKNYKFADSATYQVRVYYKSGKIQMRGATSNRNVIRKTGNFIYYYENGNKKTIINYRDNRPTGDFFEFYENGKMKYVAEKLIVDVKSDNKVGFASDEKIKNYWNEKGEQIVTDGYGFMDSKNGRGKLVNYVKDSIWTGSIKNTKSTYIEKYDKGTFISGVRIDSNNVENKYTALESKPYPKKGMKHFYEYIGRNYKTPNMQGLKGKVFVSFVVDKDGHLTDIRVIKEIGFGTGEEAIRVIKGYGDWIPGEQRGQKVRCSFGIPINIKSTY